MFEMTSLHKPKCQSVDLSEADKEKKYDYCNFCCFGFTYRICFCMNFDIIEFEVAFMYILQGIMEIVFISLQNVIILCYLVLFNETLILPHKFSKCDIIKYITLGLYDIFG